ncbi:MAG: hypothetical protein DI589_26950 [Shinella sp.]|nr:MAG: hypothetical protein DI589_26950 [Shinella sp.]
MTMDVSFRLRLQNELSRDAKTAERDLKGLGEAAQKIGKGNGSDNLGRKIREIGNEADRAERPLGRLGQQARNLENPLGLLGSAAKGAMAGLIAFASVDNILRNLEQMSEGFRKLNRDVMDVAITLEMASPEAVAKITKSNERLGIRYGRPLGEVNDARKRYAAAGVGFDSQEMILDPTLKAGMTYKTSGETIASAMIAAKQNLGIKDADITAAIDMMAKGDKLGSFGVGAMAKNFPSLGAYMPGLGRTGLDGWSELVAMSQVAMQTAGSEDEAANNLRNWLSKLTSKDTNENFNKQGVSLEKLKAKTDAAGTSYPLAVLDEVMKLTGGDQFKIGELFGDQQAGLALKPLLENRAMFESFLNEIRNNSAGMMEKDSKAAASTAAEKKARRDAALEATGSKIGEIYDRQTSPLADRAVRLVNPEYNRQRTIEEQPELLKNTSLERLKIENEILRIQGMKREMGDGGGGSALGPQLNRLKAQLETLVEEEAAIIERSRQALEEETPPPAKDNGDLGVSSGNIPIPTPRPIEQKLGADLSGAAEKAMGGYNERLATEADRAVSIATESATEMQRVLNFTAHPTIQPTFTPPAAAPAGEKHSSIENSSNVRLTQNISAPNPKLAGIRSRREQARAIQQAQARSLYDLGSRPA